MVWELAAAGLVTADGFENLRALIDPKRRLATAKNHGRRARFVPRPLAILRSHWGLTPVQYGGQTSEVSAGANVQLYGGQTPGSCRRRRSYAMRGKCAALAVFRDLVARRRLLQPGEISSSRFVGWKRRRSRGGRFVSALRRTVRPARGCRAVREIRRDQNVGAARTSRQRIRSIWAALSPPDRGQPLSGLVVPLWEESTPDDKMGQTVVFPIL